MQKISPFVNEFLRKEITGFGKATTKSAGFGIRLKKERECGIRTPPFQTLISDPQYQVPYISCQAPTYNIRPRPAISGPDHVRLF